MPIQEPQSPLWTAVKPLVAGALGGSGWIDTDEEAVRALAAQWTSAGEVFGSAMSGNQRPPGFVGPVANEAAAWPDDAGFTWTTRRLRLGADVEKQGAEMQTLAAHVTAFAEDVIHTKQQIVQTIQANAAGYDQLAMPNGAGPAAQEAFAAEVARAIVAFVDEMAARVAGRQPGVAPQAERPTVSVDPDDGNGSRWDEVADWAGVISATTSVLALGSAAVPPLALALTAVSILTGAVAAGGHTAEFVKSFTDPTATWGDVVEKGVTAGGDILGLFPAYKAARLGLQGLVDGATSAAPAWTMAAQGLGAHAPNAAEVAAQVPRAGDLTQSVSQASQVGAVIQGGTQVVPQVPTVVDLLNEGEQSEPPSITAGNILARVAETRG